MRTSFFVLILLLISSASNATTSSRWNDLMKILNKEIKILEVSKNKKPYLEYRLLELYTERIKLIMEKENNTFMRASLEKGFKGSKEDYFPKTQEEVQRIMSYGNWLLTHYKDHPYTADIYFNLGLNSRDYEASAKTEEFLQKALATKGIKSARAHLARAALAEHFFNKQAFDKALPLYKTIVQKKDDPWRAKHYYNLSWCLLKEKDFQLAFKSMAYTLDLNRQKQYVKIPDESITALGHFYVYIGKPLEAMDLFLKRTSEPLTYLIPLARNASEKNYVKEAQIILSRSQKLIFQKKDYRHLEALYHAWLDHFKAYQMIPEHQKVSLRLTNFYLKTKTSMKHQYQTDAINKFRAMAGYLQIQLTKDLKENQVNYDKRRLPQVLSYYDQLLKLDSENRAEYLYYMGETNFSVRNLKDAAVAYKDSILWSHKKKDLERVEKSLTSLFALTSEEELPKEENRKYLEFGYKTQIRLWPRDDRSRLVFQKLYSLYLEDKKDKKAAGVLTAYNRAFPGDKEIQQNLMTRIIDRYIEEKDTRRIAAWINKFKKGYLSYPADTLTKMDQVLGRLLFSEYQSLAKTGDYEKAIAGFVKTSKDLSLPGEVRAEASYLAALTYLENGQTEESAKWLSGSLDVMKEKEQLARRDEAIAVSERFYKLQDFTSSQQVSEKFLTLFCSKKDSINDRLFEISVMTSLVNGQNSKAQKIISNSSACLKKSSISRVAKEQVFEDLARDGKLQALKIFVANHSAGALDERYRLTLQSWYWRGGDKKWIEAEYTAIDHPQTKTWLQEIAQYKTAKKDALALKKLVIWNEKAFDPDKFNASLEKKILGIHSFKEKYSSLLGSSQSEISIRTTKLFVSVFETFGHKVENLRPQGMDKEIEAQFLPAMKEVGEQFLAASAQYEKQIRQNVFNGRILNSATRSIASVGGVENPISVKESAIIMDRGEIK